MITGSAHPGYPDLPSDSEVAIVSCRTSEFPPSNIFVEQKDIYLDINFSRIFVVNMILCLVIIFV
jgi:hypothetical protein